MKTRWFLTVCAAAGIACLASADEKPASLPQNSGPEARSLLDGRALEAPPLTPERRAELEANLSKAIAAYEANPRDETAIVWLGRRLAYLGRYRDAVEIYSRGLKEKPGSVALLRHRGHRYITLRRFDDAVQDLSRAAGLIESQQLPDQVEPDGTPNPAHPPRSSLHENVYYHLGLARYLRGEFDEASRVYRKAMSLLTMNDDMRVAFRYWLYNAESHAGRLPQAGYALDGISEKMDVLENHAYHKLLLAFKGGGEKVDQALEGLDRSSLDYLTTAYGVATWHLTRNNKERATGLMRDAMTIEQWWPAFGFIAAEVELSRLK